jgi:hypothetical protein
MGVWAGKFFRQKGQRIVVNFFTNFFFTTFDLYFSTSPARKTLSLLTKKIASPNGQLFGRGAIDSYDESV